MITRQKKGEILIKLKDKLSNSTLVIMVNFHKMSVAKSTQLRKALRANDAAYIVSKKTLLDIAAKDAGLVIDKRKLEGEVGMVFASGEVIDTAKVVANFVKKNKEILRIMGGFYEKLWIEESQVKKLASIPPREILLAQLLQVLNAPARNLVGVLAAPMRNLTVVLGKIKK